MAVGDTPNDGRYEALLDLLRTSEALWNASRLFFAEWELSPSQFNVLNLLRRFPDGCTQTDLSKDLIMHRSNVSGLVDRLEERGLVKRLDKQEDRRAYRIVLTPSGRRLVKQILPRYYKTAKTVWSRLTDARVAAFGRDLKLVRDSVAGISTKLTSDK